MTPPAALRTAAGLGEFVSKVRAVLDAVTETVRLGESQPAQTAGALSRLVRSVATLGDSVAPVGLAQTEVVVTPPGVGRTETVVRVLVAADTHWERGGRDVWTVEFVLSLLTVPLSVTHLVTTDAATQSTPDTTTTKILIIPNKLELIGGNWNKIPPKASENPL